MALPDDVVELRAGAVVPRENAIAVQYERTLFPLNRPRRLARDFAIHHGISSQILIARKIISICDCNATVCRTMTSCGICAMNCGASASSVDQSVLFGGFWHGLATQTLRFFGRVVQGIFSVFGHMAIA
jgi:hypothetical protein